MRKIKCEEIFLINNQFNQFLLLFLINILLHALDTPSSTRFRKENNFGSYVHRHQTDEKQNQPSDNNFSSVDVSKVTPGYSIQFNLLRIMFYNTSSVLGHGP